MHIASAFKVKTRRRSLLLVLIFNLGDDSFEHMVARWFFSQGFADNDGLGLL